MLFYGVVVLVRPHRAQLRKESRDLTDFEWVLIAPLLPKVRGKPRVDDRATISGILWRLRTGLAWSKLPPMYGIHTTCQGRFMRWRQSGVWARIVTAVETAYGPEVEWICAEETDVRPMFRAPSPPSADNVVWVSKPRRGKINATTADAGIAANNGRPSNRAYGEPIVAASPILAGESM